MNQAKFINFAHPVFSAVWALDLADMLFFHNIV